MLCEEIFKEETTMGKILFQIKTVKDNCQKAVRLFSSYKAPDGKLTLTGTHINTFCHCQCD